MSDKRKVILDCDPGHDDAFAIMLAAAHLDLLGITTIGGNCSLQNVTKNALKVLEVIGRQDIKVYPGHSCPLVAPLVTAPQFHGPSGMDGPVLPEPSIKAQEKHGVDFIIDTVMGTDDVTLIATGPLTNIAAAINKEPGIVGRVKELSIMGGFYRIGTRSAVFAAQLVEYFMDATEKNASLAGANIHDACAVAWLIDEKLIQAVPMHITVELKGEFTRGMTVCDYRHLRGPEPDIDLHRKPTMDFRGEEPNAEAALELDFEGFTELLDKTLACYP